MLRPRNQGASAAVRYLAKLVLILGLGACSSAPFADTPDPEGEPAEHRFDPASGEESMVIATARGKATMRSGTAVPVHLPRGLSPYPGAVTTASTRVTHPDGVSTLATFAAPASGAEIIAHFRREAQGAGFAVEIDTTFGQTAMFSARRAADGARIMVSTEPPQDGLTSAQIVIGAPQAAGT